MFSQEAVMPSKTTEDKVANIGALGGAVKGL